MSIDSDVQRFLAQGGKIQQIPQGVSNDPNSRRGVSGTDKLRQINRRTYATRVDQRGGK
jgi:hypothetical protein